MRLLSTPTLAPPADRSGRFGGSVSLAYVGGDDPSERGPQRDRGPVGRFLWTPWNSGDVASEDECVGIETVLACIKVIAETFASLPLHPHKASGIPGTDTWATVPATGHPLAPIVSLAPNDELTSYEWRVAAIYEILLRGNTVAVVARNKQGVPTGLYPIPWSSVTPTRVESTGKLVYEYAPPKGRKRVYESHEILHIRGLAPDGILGLSLLDTQRQLLSATRDANNHARDIVKNGAAPGGIVEVDHTLTDSAYSRMRTHWRESPKGDIQILEDGAKWKTTAFNAEDTQLLESRKFNRSLVAAYFRVPAHMINDLEKATFSNIEHQDIQFSKHTILPHTVNWVQRLSFTLLTPDEIKAGYYFDFDMSRLERGDFQSLMAGYQSGVHAGIWSPNEVRAKLKENGYKGGDVHVINSGVTTIDALNNPPEVKPQPSKANG